MSYRSDLYEKHKDLRRTIIHLAGLSDDQIKALLKRYVVSLEASGDNFILKAKRRNGEIIEIINSTRKKCLRDLLTILGYKF